MPLNSDEATKPVAQISPPWGRGWMLLQVLITSSFPAASRVDSTAPHESHLRTKRSAVTLAGRGAPPGLGTSSWWGHLGATTAI